MVNDMSKKASSTRYGSFAEKVLKKQGWTEGKTDDTFMLLRILSLILKYT